MDATLDCYYNTRVRLTVGTLGTSHWTVIIIQGSASPWVPCGRHTGLSLVTANERSAAQGNTWGLTLLSLVLIASITLTQFYTIWAT